MMASIPAPPPSIGEDSDDDDHDIAPTPYRPSTRKHITRARDDVDAGDAGSGDSAAQKDGNSRVSRGPAIETSKRVSEATRGAVAHTETSTLTNTPRAMRRVGIDVRNNSRRKVRFTKDPDQECMYEECEPPLTDEEIDELWYTRADYKRIKKSYQFILQLMAMGRKEEDENPDDVCFRGLEFKTKKGYRRRKRDKDMSIDIVLSEQERQWEKGRQDPEYMARMYSQSVAHCTLQAFLAGQRDATAVYGDDKTASPSSSSSSSSSAPSAQTSQQPPTPARPSATQILVSDSIAITTSKREVLGSNHHQLQNATMSLKQLGCATHMASLNDMLQQTGSNRSVFHAQ